jgi:hypothetical protein
MTASEEKLAKWTQLYSGLEEARGRLKALIARRGSGRSAVKKEVIALKRECGVALDELQAEYARVSASSRAKLATNI